MTIIAKLFTGEQLTHQVYRYSGGGDRPVRGGLKGCRAPDAAEARRTMLRLWPSDSIPGEAAQLLPCRGTSSR